MRKILRNYTSYIAVQMQTFTPYKTEIKPEIKDYTAFHLCTEGEIKVFTSLKLAKTARMQTDHTKT